MNYHPTFAKALFTLALLFVSFFNLSLAQNPAWALGEQPNFSGVIANWALGDAIASGEGIMNIVNEAFFDLDFDGEHPDIGFGSIKPDGSFSLGLVRDAAGSAAPPGWCPEIKASSPDLRVATMQAIEVPALYVEGVHARPFGNIVIGTEPLTLANVAKRENYVFIYADRNATYKGSCTHSVEGYSFGLSFDLELRKGWNSVRVDLGQSLSLKTAAIPTAAQWYLVNPLTLGGE